MRAGQYDRRIRIEQNSSAVDPQYGTAVPGWVAVAEVWAQVQDVLPSRAESQSDSVRLASRPSRIRVRWNVSLAAIGTGAMRIVHSIKSLQDVYPYYRDQQQYVSMARQARDELEAMFARDAEVRAAQRKDGWD